MAASPIPWRGRVAVVAASGGADSTFLLLAACALRRRFGHRVAVAHVDHGWRGAAARGDAAAVARLAAALGVPAHVRVVIPAELAGAGGPEAAARAARYAFLAEVAAATDAAAILVAHTADDQAETILLSLLRGRSVAGLAGMSAIAPLPLSGATIKAPVVRPMLGIPASTVRDTLRAFGVSWREDASNGDRTRARNRLRLDIVPGLEAISPGFRAALARSAGDVAGARAMLDDATAAAAGKWHHDGETWRIARSEWLSVPAPVRLGALRLVAMRAGAAPEEVESGHLAAVDRMVEANRGGASRLIGPVSVRLQARHVVVSAAPPAGTGAKGTGTVVHVPDRAGEWPRERGSE